VYPIIKISPKIGFTPYFDVLSDKNIKYIEVNDIIKVKIFN